MGIMRKLYLIQMTFTSTLDITEGTILPKVGEEKLA